MSLKLRVKLGNVSNLSDARYAAGMGVEAVGFDVTESSTVSVDQMNEIINWISGVDVVGETGENGTPAYGYSFDYIETTDIEKISSERPVILKLDLSNYNFKEIETIIENYGDRIKYLIITLSPSQIKEFSAELKIISNKIDLFLSSDIKPEILELLMSDIGPAGIELSGGVEDKPGFKDYDELADVLEALESDF